MANPNRILRAAEIAEYLYCHRAWWLRRVAGIEPSSQDDMEMGLTRHLTHARQIRQAERLARIAFVFVALAAFLATLWLFVLMLEAG
jgi:hypothetical protein